MEIIDFGRKDGTCIKCHRELSTSEKISGMPICSKCISGLVDIIKDRISGDDLKEFSDNVSNFTDFISSSSKLMGLEDIVVVQVCFNVYMDMVRTMGKRNSFVAKKIFKDAKMFIDMELERLEDGGEDIFDKDRDGGKEEEEEEDPFGKMISRLNLTMREHNALDNNKKSDVEKGNVDDKKDISEGDMENREDVNNGNEDGKIDSNGDNIVDGSNDYKNGNKRIKID